MARRRTEYDLGTMARVVFGIVTRALEDVLVGVLALDPLGDWASGVRANRRIGDDTVGRTRPRIVIKLARVKPDDQDFIEYRAAADDRRFRVLRPGVYRRTAELQIVGLDDCALVVPFREDQQFPFLRPLVTAGFVIRR